MAQIKLKDIEVRGKKISVFVEDSGSFKAQVDTDTWVHAKTLEDLTKKVQDATRETSKLSIEFWRWDDGELKRGIILGLHAGSRNIRIKLGADKAEQEYPWDTSPEKYMKLDDYERETYIGLCQDAERAAAAKADYERSHSFDAVKAIRAELGPAAAAEV